VTLVLSSRSAFLSFKKNIEGEFRVLDGCSECSRRKGENCQGGDHSVLTRDAMALKVLVTASRCVQSSMVQIYITQLRDRAICEGSADVTRQTPQSAKLQAAAYGSLFIHTL